MKKIVTIIAMLFAAQFGSAQSLTLLTFESYSFPDKFDTSYGYGKIQDGFQWGVGLEYGIGDANAIELIYQQLNTEGYANGYYSGPDPNVTTSLVLSYIMLGGTRYQPLSETVSGFGSLDLGAAIAAPGDRFENVTKFAWGLRGGVRIMPPGGRISFRLHAQLMSAVQGFGLIISTGGGGASAYSTIYQFNLGGSLNLRLK